MSDLSPISPDEWDILVNQVRMHNTAKLREVLTILEPYVDGSVGMVSPPHVKLYLAALKDLGAMYKVSEGPKRVEEPVVEDPAVEVLRLEAAQARVLEQLEILAAKARRRGVLGS